MFPKRTVSSFKHRILLMGVALAYFPQIRNWYRISDNPWLTQARERFPLMHGAIYIPYIHLDWPLPKRLATIDQHYRMLHGPAAILARATFEEVELASLNEEYAGLRLVLDKAEWFSREGEVVLNLFVHKQRFYSVAFTLGMEAGQPLIFIGALQGSNVEAAAAVYREMTHALHGMRPRDLLMAALKLLSRQFGIHRIWAISGAKRYKVRANYDQIWQEHRGQLLDNGFFEIPAEVRYRQMDEIASRKRKVYRQRYQMLEQITADIAMICAGTSIAPPKHHPTAELRTIHDGMFATD